MKSLNVRAPTPLSALPARGISSNFPPTSARAFSLIPSGWSLTRMPWIITRSCVANGFASACWAAPLPMWRLLSMRCCRMSQKRRCAIACEFFENFSQIHRLLESLADVGLGYVKLGQPSTTLSGGEAQRVKLATQLARVDTGKTLYLLDEPTTGLHFDDIRKLLEVLGKLVDRGNTVIVIEHNLDVIKCADWLVDLGPEGGEAGGHLVAEGPPELIAEIKDNHTGRFLAPQLAK